MNKVKFKSCVNWTLLYRAQNVKNHCLKVKLKFLYTFLTFKHFYNWFDCDETRGGGIHPTMNIRMIPSTTSNIVIHRYPLIRYPSTHHPKIRWFKLCYSFNPSIIDPPSVDPSSVEPFRVSHKRRHAIAL